MPNDRIYSIFDLLTQMQRFTMRALKGIRKGDDAKLRINLLISFSWMMSIANRLHIDIEDQVWERFPAVCSYCGFAPCTCRKTRPKKRVETKGDPSRRPTTMNGIQDMFRSIYPPTSRTLSEAGVHLAEETGEVAEAIHNFLGQHFQKQFDGIKFEIADYVSCIFGVANSASFQISPELKRMFEDGCHVCRKTPCTCKFAEVVAFQS